MIVLSKKGQVSAVVDDLILTAITLDSQANDQTSQQVLETIEVFFGFSLNEIMVRDSLHRLKQRGELVTSKNSNSVVLAPHTRANVQSRIEQAKQLENEVRQEWFELIEYGYSDMQDEWYGPLWSILQRYMGKAFRQHGAETVLLLDPSSSLVETPKSLSTFLHEAIEEEKSKVPKELAAELIRMFFSQPTTSRTRYIAQLLDGTFAFFSLSADQATANYLRGTVAPLALFLDTNFIFGILDLHSNPFDDASKELVEAIQQQGFPFKLYYHKVTLEELESTLEYYGTRLKGHVWTSSVSRAAIKTLDNTLSGLELAYHEKNAQSPLSPEVFLSKYKYIKDLLASKHKFKIYNEAEQSDEEKQERYTLVAEYRHFIDTYRSKSKRYQALNHDIRVLQTVAKLRNKADSPLDSGSFFITADFFLYRFAWEKLRQKNEIGLVVLPNQFLQLLRPFIPTTDDFDRRFVETFSIPEFRSLGQYSSVSVKVLEYINEYSDIEEQTAIRILTNEVLRGNLAEVQDDSEQFQAVIEKALLADNQRLMEEVEELQENAQQIAQERAELEAQKQAEVERLEQERRRLELLSADKDKRANQVERQLHELQKIKEIEVAERDKEIAAKDKELRKLEYEVKLRDKQVEDQQRLAVQRQKNYRILAMLLVIFVDTIVIWFGSRIISWEWLVNHPNRLGLYGVIWLINLCAAAAYLLPEWRREMVIAGILGAVLVFFQILGP